MNPIELNEKIRCLRKGEEVVCWHCKKGIMIPVGNCKTTKCFYCEVCGARLNID